MQGLPSKLAHSSRVHPFGNILARNRAPESDCYRIVEARSPADALRTTAGSKASRDGPRHDWRAAVAAFQRLSPFQGSSSCQFSRLV